MHSLYNYIILLLLSLFLSVNGFFAIFHEPIVGDLTRIGGYTENDFGWNKPQERFYKPLFRHAQSIKEYNRHYDVIVLGDSFTFAKSSWLSYFAEMTGLSIIAFDLRKIRVGDIIESRFYKENPPRFFVYESVERELVKRLLTLDLKMSHPIDPKNLPSGKIVIQPIGVKKYYQSRLKSSKIITRVSEAMNHIKKLPFRIIDYPLGTVLFDLKNHEKPMFSNKRHRNILIYREDFNKVKTTENQIKRSAKNIIKLQGIIESNGRTDFMLLVFPDKSTVYSRYLKSSQVIPSDLFRLHKYYPLLRLDNSFVQAIDDGIIDLYLPNDTHTGYMGNQITANTLLNKLLRRNQ